MNAQFGTASDFTFQQLHPDTILDAIESLEIYPTTGLLALNSYENRVYQFATDEARFVVKFYRGGRWSDAQIQEEHDYSLALQADDIPVVAPLVLKDNTLHHFRDTRFAVFPSVGGRQLEVDNLDHLEWVGRFLGRIHMVGQAKPFTHRAEFSVDSHLTQPLAILRDTPLLPLHLREAFLPFLNLWYVKLPHATHRILLCASMVIVIRVISCGEMDRVLLI